MSTEILIIDDNADIRSILDVLLTDAGFISLVDVSKLFGDFLALDSVNLDIDESQKIVICGPSGSGKSTLLRLLLKQLAPASGSVLDGGRHRAPWPCVYLRTCPVLGCTRPSSARRGARGVRRRSAEFAASPAPSWRGRPARPRRARPRRAPPRRRGLPVLPQPGRGRGRQRGVHARGLAPQVAPARGGRARVPARD
mgnify:CR=1 FL=1